MWVFPEVGSRLASPPWGYALVAPAGPRMCRICAVEKILEVALQVRLIFLRGPSVHADGPVFVRQLIGLVKPLDVNVMGQVREGHIRAVPGEFRDPLSFRVHGVRSLGVPGMFPSNPGVRPRNKSFRMIRSVQLLLQASQLPAKFRIGR